MNKLINGFFGLTNSRKGALSLIILTISAVLAAFGKLDPTFAAVVATIQVIFCWTQSKTDQAAINSTTTPTPYVEGGMPDLPTR